MRLIALAALAFVSIPASAETLNSSFGAVGTFDGIPHLIAGYDPNGIHAREASMSYLRTLDIGYGHTADGGKTFPFRGKGVGLMPSLD